MARERAEQPEMFARILRDGWPGIRACGRHIAARHPRTIFFLARGSSENAAVYARYRTEVRLGVPAGVLSPASMTVYGALPDFTGCLVVAVSQSGTSPDLLESMERARETAAATIALTNDPGSPLAQSAEFHLDLLAGPERAVTATKSYTAELLTLYCLVEALVGAGDPGLAGLPEHAAALLRRDDEVRSLAERLHDARSCLTIGRGYNYATAREAALKLMETSYLPTVALSSAELLHGPIAAVEAGSAVLAVVPEGPGGTVMADALDRLRDTGADLMVVGDPAAVERAGVGLPCPDLGPEEISPLLLILPLQALAWHLAALRGHDPDAPRGLVKATHTW